MQAHTKVKCTAFKSQLLVEEINNRVKANVSKSSNTSCNPQRAMAAAIDACVLSKVKPFRGGGQEMKEHNFDHSYSSKKWWVTVRHGKEDRWRINK